MDSINRLKELFSSNGSDRIAKEKQQQDRAVDPNLLRHTLYQGDRTIQQLGQEPIENGVILNNQSLSIGDVMSPLAKGNVLRRVDNTNGGALLGTAYRDALENDYDANGNRRNAPLSRNGGNEPSNPNNPNKPRRNPDRVPPPSGCTPPPPKCFWSSNPIAPKGFQSHGDAVVNENGVPTYLHCMAGANAPSNLNCRFLDKRWSCLNGVCFLNPSGAYTSQAQCEATLTRTYYVEIRGTYLDNFGVFQSGGVGSKIVSQPGLALTEDGVAGTATSGELAYWYKIGSSRFTEAGWRRDAVSVAIYRINSSICP